MRKLHYAFIGIIGLIIAGLLVGPSLLDWNSYKPQIMAAVTDALGRELRIVGDINVTILPSPALNVKRVSLANVEGADNREMIAFDEVEVKIDASALLQGTIAVTSIRMIRPVIALEITKNGRTSWDIRRPKTSSEEAQETTSENSLESSSGLAVDVSLDSILIENAIVSFSDARSGFTERIEGLTAEIAAETLKGPFRARGQMAMRGIPLSFDLALGQMDPDRPLRVKLRTTHDTTSSEFRFTGQLSELTLDAVLLGEMNLAVPDLATLAGSIGITNLPPVIASPLSLSAETSASAAGIDVNKLLLQFGDMSFAGAIHGQLKPNIGLDVVLSSSRIDLDRLLATHSAPSKLSADAQGRPSVANTKSTSPSKPRTVTSYTPFTLPTNMSLTLDLGVEAATYGGGIIRNASLRSSFEKGVVTLETLSASLPGNSNFTVSGRIAAVDDLPAFQGDIEVSSDNFRSLLHWLGVASNHLPKDRLRNFSYTSKLKATPNSASVTDISIQLDASRIEGGMALELRKKLGVGLRLAIDKLNLDAYLPKSPKENASSANSRELMKAKNLKNSTPAPKADRAAAIATKLDLLLNVVDANIELDAAHIIFAGETARKVKANLTIFNHTIKLREASVADFGGIGASITGNLAMKGGKPTFAAKYAAVMHDPSRVVRLLGGEFSQVAAHFDKMSSNGRVEGTLDDLKANLQIKALGASTSVQGAISRPLANPSVNLRVSVEHPELSAFARNFVPSYRPEAKTLGPLDIAGSVLGDAKAFVIDKLGIKAGPVTATGVIKGTFAAKKPKLDLDLRTSEVLLDLFLLRSQPGETAPASTSRQGNRSSHGSITSEGRTGTIQKQRWSYDPIISPIPKSFDAVVNIEMAALTKGDIRLQTPKLRAVLTSGRLAIKEFQGQIFGGAVSGRATIQPSGKKTAVTAELNIDKLESRLAAKSLTGHDRLKGPLTMKANFATQGNSEASFVSELNGRASLTGQMQVLLTKSERNRIGVISAGSNLLANLLGGKVQALQKLAPFTQLLASLDQAFGRNPAHVSGEISLTHGRIQTNNLVLAGQGNTATTQATIDLPRWQLSSTTKLVDDPRREPLVTFSATGPIDAPSRTRVGGRLLKQGTASVRGKASNPLQQVLPGLLGGKSGGQSQSDDKKKFNPGKLLEGIFKQFQR